MVPASLVTPDTPDCEPPAEPLMVIATPEESEEFPGGGVEFV